MKKYLQKLDTLGLLLLVAAVIWYSVSDIWSKGNLSLVIIGGILVIVGVAANYKQIMASLGKRSTKYASNYVVSLILVIAIVSGLNYVGQRHVKRFDMTEIGRYSLAPQTIQVLNKLSKDIEIKAFFPGGEYAPLKELLTEYRTESRHIKYSFIDPDRQPAIAKQYDVTVYGKATNPLTGTELKFGTLVVAYGNRQEKIEKRSEEIHEVDLTNAIIKVGRAETKKIYFIQGHGEKDPANTEKDGFSQAQKALEAQSYEVGTVNLAAEGKVPADAKVLILAGPKTAPFEQELTFINDFLNTGKGGLLAMVDPVPSPSLQQFFNEWGVQIDNDLILDVSGAGRLIGADESIPLVLRYEKHKITDRLAMTFFPLTRSIQPAKNAPGITVETLFKSNPNSWGETDFNTTSYSFDQGKDLRGPLPIAVAATKEIQAATDQKPGSKARITVVGNSNFAIDAYFAMQGNGNLFLNMVSWLAQDEDLISIRPKQPTDRRIMLSESQSAMIRLFTIFILPGIALVVGIIVFMNRRRR
jgi:ABC-type uncharacterized transport system involved in gliding motility auxiliary subunit